MLRKIDRKKDTLVHSVMLVRSIWGAHLGLGVLRQGRIRIGVVCHGWISCEATVNPSQKHAWRRFTLFRCYPKICNFVRWICSDGYATNAVSSSGLKTHRTRSL